MRLRVPDRPASPAAVRGLPAEADLRGVEVDGDGMVVDAEEAPRLLAEVRAGGPGAG